MKHVGNLQYITFLKGLAILGVILVHAPQLIKEINPLIREFLHAVLSDASYSSSFQVFSQSNPGNDYWLNTKTLQKKIEPLIKRFSKKDI